MEESISGLNVLDPRLVELLAAELNTNPGLVEKDWHVVRALGVLASLDHGDASPAFSGGTSLSKGWRLIKRFSEDIDFKIAMPPSGSRSKDRKRRKAYRDRVLAALAAVEFTLAGEVLKGNEDSFFAADFSFTSSFASGPGLRPHLRVEMTFQASVLPPVARPIRSLIGEAQRLEPEVPAFPCIDPVETAADKLSALAWRVCTRERGSERDDPTIIRHLHDLAALAGQIQASATFRDLVRQATRADTGRGGGRAPTDPSERFVMMLDRLQREEFWATDYDEYVRQVSYAKIHEQISFAAALDMLTALTDQLRTEAG
jgi:hypothetical protein